MIFHPYRALRSLARYPVPQPASSTRSKRRLPAIGSSRRNRISRMPRYHHRSRSAAAMLANSAGFIMGIEKGPHVLFEAWRAADRVSSVDGPRAAEIEEDGAGFLQDYLDRSQVPRRHLRLDPNVHFTGGDHHRIGRAAQASERPETAGPID